MKSAVRFPNPNPTSLIFPKLDDEDTFLLQNGKSTCPLKTKACFPTSRRACYVHFGFAFIGDEIIKPRLDDVDQVLANGIEAVPTSLLKGVTSNNEPEHRHYQQYQKKLGITDELIAHSPSIKAHFDRWYLVQRFREEFMAETIAMMVHKYQTKTSTDTSHWTTVLAGENHILGREGIPSRALRRASAKDGALHASSTISKA